MVRRFAVYSEHRSQSSKDGLAGGIELGVTGMKDHFTLQSSALPQGTRVAAFKGIEALSTPYSFEVDLLVPNEQELDLGDVVGDSVTLVLEPEAGHQICGVIATFELFAEAGSYGLFRATIVPRLWHLTLNRHSRVFVGESVVDIVRKVLDANDFTSADFVFRLNGKYKAIEHVCQYQESDFNFISRWMEREGLYYFFEHKDGGEVMVITDDRSFHVAKSDKPVRFVQQLGSDASAGASLDTFLCRRTTLPTKVALKDYDYLKPKLDVSGSASVSKAGQGAVHVYGDNFTTPDDGKRLAKLRAEELLARQTIYTGEGRVYGLGSGYRFTLDEHPRSAFNTEYLAVAVHHYGNQSSTASAFQKLIDIEYDEPYHVRVEAIEASVQYRAPRETPTPRIYGTEEAVIDAENGVVYAEVDDHGRYKVKILFDESDLEDGNASMWVRMLQPHGGDIEGFHFPLRKGTEVHLVFLGGDPDRPVIAGVAHNAHNPSAINQRNNTRNVLQTGGKNRIEMEDQEGGQWIHMKTEPKGTFLFMGAANRPDGGKDDNAPAPWSDDYNWHMSSDGTGKLRTHGKLDVLVDSGPMTIKVEGNTFLHHVKGAVTENYDATLSTTVKAATDLHYQNTLLVDVTGATTELLHDTLEQHVTGAVAQTYDVAHLLNTGARTDTIRGNLEQTVSGNITITATGDIETTAKDVRTTRTGTHWESTTGFSNEYYFAGRTELYIGYKLGTTIGATLDLFVGSKSDIKASIGLDIAAGVVIERGPTKIDLDDVKVVKNSAILHKVGAKIQSAEVSIWSAAVNLLC